MVSALVHPGHRVYTRRRNPKSYAPVGLFLTPCGAHMTAKQDLQLLTDALLDALEQDENLELRARADEAQPPAYYLRELPMPAGVAAPAPVVALQSPAVRGSTSAAAARETGVVVNTEESVEGTIRCPACNAENARHSKYCAACGSQLHTSLRGDSSAPMVSGGYRVPAARTVTLISINEDGSDGNRIDLRYADSVVGRSGDIRFPTDAFLSPKHARISIEDRGVFIEDLYSLNGTYIKLRSEIRLTPGDTFLMGRQVLRLEKLDTQITPKARAGDGTRYMGSPPPTGHFKLIQVGIGGALQNVYCLNDTGALIGREKGNIIFPHDKFMSGRHAQIFAKEDGHYYLLDVGSSNGTWIKIWERRELTPGDFVFLGQQLFRVEMS